MPDGASEGPANPATDTGALHWHLKLDANGNPEERTDPRGITVVSTFGVLNRLEIRDVPRARVPDRVPLPALDGLPVRRERERRARDRAEEGLRGRRRRRGGGSDLRRARAARDRETLRREARPLRVFPQGQPQEGHGPRRRRHRVPLRRAGSAPHRHDARRRGLVPVLAGRPPQGHLAPERPRGGALLRPGGPGRRHRHGARRDRRDVPGRRGDGLPVRPRLRRERKPDLPVGAADGAGLYVRRYARGDALRLRRGQTGSSASATRTRPSSTSSTRPGTGSESG